MSRNILAARYRDKPVEQLLDALAASEREIQVLRAKANMAARDRKVLLARIRAPDAALRAMLAETHAELDVLQSRFNDLTGRHADLRDELDALLALVGG